MYKNNKISEKQLNILLTANIFGTGIVMLPRIAFEFGRFYSFIFILLAGIIAMCATLIIKKLTNIYKDKSFYEYSSDIVGRPIAFLLVIGFAVRLCIYAIIMVKIFLELTKNIILPNTPMWITSLCVILVSAYAASKGYEARARMAEIFLPLIIIPIAITYVIAIFNVDYSALAIEPIHFNFQIKNSIFILNAFTGIELLLHIRPYSKIKVSKTIMWITAAMMLITLITQLNFGAYVTELKFPVIEMMDRTTRRQGPLMMSFFIMSIFSILNACLFFSSISLGSVFKKISHTFYILLFSAIIFIGTFFNFNVYEALSISFITLGIAYMIIIPSLLLILSKVSLFKIIILAISVIFLVSCGTELSELEFVTSMKIESEMIKFKTEEEVKISKNTNLEEAIKEINENSTKNLYFGFTELIIVDKVSKELLDEISNLRNLSKNTALLTIEQIEELPQKVSIPKKFEKFTIDYYEKLMKK